MTRMNLSQLIQFLINENQTDCAEYFACFTRGEQVPGQVVDGLIDANLVKWYFNEVEPSGQLLRKIQANVTSYIGYNPKYYQNPSTGEQWTEAQYLEYVAFEENRHNADNVCEDCYGCEKCEG